MLSAIPVRWRWLVWVVAIWLLAAIVIAVISHVGGGTSIGPITPLKYK